MPGTRGPRRSPRRTTPRWWTPATRTGNLVTDCRDEACVSQYNGGSPVVIALTVSVVDGTTATESGKFGIAADLGGLIGQATYKEAADA